ncbi:thioredoxin-like protein [Rhizopus microsporus var. microsporus]|uniref:Thioredoxin-like protein n=2 Tax=Rhizopus microsporus TaxID=58291 RepID=A0A2G4SKG1_RHIZD|nr:thioredoxin-like protein [Rhizopus microsporus ATCC 52813]ORE06270.1 thioredoxin-like protein [Rhizopus microsporus var. microsporus]PHZ09267.1 thioredoxin-like protein [Rhizopus microsporus ATCC 52813]
MSQTISIKATIDTVCPWCFIGKRRLDKAIQKMKEIHSNVSIQVQYLPFQLNPHQEGSVDKMESYNKKFGEERVKSMIPMVTKVAEGEGIHLKYGGVISNTFDSHRLVWWSQQFGKQSEVVEEICKLYFERNEDVGDHESLANAAERAGLSKDGTIEFIKSEQGVSEVKDLLRRNAFMDIHGVPHFTINDKYAVSGAQETDTLVNVFQHVLSKEQ